MTNDMMIIGGIAFILVTVGLVLPFISEEFGTDQVADYDVNSFNDALGQDVKESDGISAITIFGSVFKMFFWTFGDLPWFLDGFFLVLRIVLGLTIARNIWVGGGS